MLPIYNQTKLDPKLTLGKSTVSARGYACNALNVQSLLPWAGYAPNCFKGPIKAGEILTADIYSPDGMLDYDRLNVWLTGKGSKLRFVRRFSDESLAAHYVNETEDYAVIMQVKVKKAYTHFMACLSYSPILGWKVADTLTGTARYLKMTGYELVDFRLYLKV